MEDEEVTRVLPGGPAWRRRITYIQIVIGVIMILVVWGGGVKQIVIKDRIISNRVLCLFGYHYISDLKLLNIGHFGGLYVNYCFTCRALFVRKDKEQL